MGIRCPPFSRTKPNLLLCFDAFGTLFSPKGSVALQYAQVARQCGLRGVDDEQVRVRLHAAMREEATLNPNYGKATGLGATGWWTNVIQRIFEPLAPDGKLPEDLAPKLMQLFTSRQGYDPEPTLLKTLEILRERRAQRCYDELVIGVITNSDDRVPDVLSDLGVRVRPLRYGNDDNITAVGTLTSPDMDRSYDVDFHCISYDVGAEKPDKVIFDSAKHMLARLIAARHGIGMDAARVDVDSWEGVFVGDDLAKDGRGSADAGWHPIMLDPADQFSDLPKLNDQPLQPLTSLFRALPMLKVNSLEELAIWLTGGGSG